MDEFESILDLFGIGEVRETAFRALQLHGLSIMALLGLGYHAERAYFRGKLSDVDVEFRAEEIVKFHQLRSAGAEPFIPVIVWAHPDRAADMHFSTGNRLKVEYHAAEAYEELYR